MCTAIEPASVQTSFHIVQRIRILDVIPFRNKFLFFSIVHESCSLGSLSKYSAALS